MQKAVEKTLNECLPLAYGSVGSELQADGINRLAALHEQVGKLWGRSRTRRRDDDAALAFACLRFIGGTASLLRMWLWIKQDDMAAAWDSLVDAQDEIECGLRFLDWPEMHNAYGVLLMLEKGLFPRQQFVSPSLVFEYALCTICGGVYGDCGHVVGRLYAGQMCSMSPKNFTTFDHVAFVEHPYDKGCRVTEMQSGDRMVCALTRRDAGEAKEREDGHTQWTTTVLRPSRDSSVARMKYVGERRGDELVLVKGG
jgi:hypothetical protein